MQNTSSEWKVWGNRQLSGTVTVNGSKNCTLAILGASLLTTEPVLLYNVPRLSDVDDMVSVLQSAGSHVSWQDANTLSIQRPVLLDVKNLDIHAARRTRAIALLTAGFAMDHDAFTLPLPGGCQLGDRSLEPHIDALDQLGLHVQCRAGGMHVRRLREGRSGTVINLLESGDTVSENAILTAVALRRDRIQIRNASCNYMVQDLCHFVQTFGHVSIEGIGSPLLTIRCCKPESRKPSVYSILEDPIEAFFFIAAAIVTESNVRMNAVPFEFISLELHLLQQMGLKLERSPDYLATNGVTPLCDIGVSARNSSLTSPNTKIHPNVFPFGINVDNLPAFGPIAALASGQTLLHDWMYEQRAGYFASLRDFGVRVELLDSHRAEISGPTDLRSASCELPPALRPASMVLLAALAAPGLSHVRHVHVLSRGYEGLVGRLIALGAAIEVREGAQAVPLSDAVIRSVI